MGRARAGATVWGDGFSTDTLRQQAGAHDWDLCDDDELARMLPALPHVGADPAREIVRRLDAVRSARAAGLASRRDRRGAAAPGVRTREDRSLETIEAHLAALRSGRVPPYDPAAAAAFGFHAGLHPAYLWPEARLSASIGTTACWLGIVSRGRPALLVPEVSEVLADSLVERDGRVSWRPGVLAELPLDALDLRALRRAVERHRDGYRPIVRRRARRRLPGPLARLWRLAASLGAGRAAGAPASRRGQDR